MLLDQINLNYLRIFESVYRTRSMTKAAQELHLTQSGISQHIKSLEESLDLKLFDRIKQKLVPTDQGQVLYEDISAQLKNLEQALLTVTSRDQLLRGEVSIGAPVVFGLNKIIPLITWLGQTHPELKFSLHFDLAHSINTMLLAGELDFGFVDDFTMDTHVKTQKTYDEVLQLVCSEEYFKKASKAHGSATSKKFYEQLDYIGYEKGEPIIRKWLGFHIKGGQFQLNVKAYVADALGISHFIKQNLGVGVLPKHHVDKIISQGEKIHVFDTKGKDLKNKISVAYVTSRTRSRAVQESFDYILESLKTR